MAAAFGHIDDLEQQSNEFTISDKDILSMKMRAFGTAGFKTSEIGLGCWQLGGTDWGAVDEAKCF